jgi:hypothetical protein
MEPFFKKKWRARKVGLIIYSTGYGLLQPLITGSGQKIHLYTGLKHFVNLS